LHDTEEKLVGCSGGRAGRSVWIRRRHACLYSALTTRGPTRCHFRAARRILVFAGIRSAFVEHHRDVAAESRLNFHRNLWSNKRRRPIDVILKINAVLGDLAQFRERKNLVTAAIGEERSVPIHKAM
jgi:hypothetical protein